MTGVARGSQPLQKNQRVSKSSDQFAFPLIAAVQMVGLLRRPDAAAYHRSIRRDPAELYGREIRDLVGGRQTPLINNVEVLLIWTVCNEADFGAEMVASDPAQCSHLPIK